MQGPPLMLDPCAIRYFAQRLRTTPRGDHAPSLQLRKSCRLREDGCRFVLQGRIWTESQLDCSEPFAQKSEWAHLPVSPLERHLLEGGPEGVERWGPESRPSKGVITFLGWAKFGGASANYLIRCGTSTNVALQKKLFERTRISCGKLHARHSISPFPPLQIRKSRQKDGGFRQFIAPAA